MSSARYLIIFASVAGMFLSLVALVATGMVKGAPAFVPFSFAGLLVACAVAFVAAVDGAPQ